MVVKIPLEGDPICILRKVPNYGPECDLGWGLCAAQTPEPSAQLLAYSLPPSPGPSQSLVSASPSNTVMTLHCPNASLLHPQARGLVCSG